MQVLYRFADIDLLSEPTISRYFGCEQIPAGVGAGVGAATQHDNICITNPNLAMGTGCLARRRCAQADEMTFNPVHGVQAAHGSGAV